MNRKMCERIFLIFLFLLGMLLGLGVLHAETIGEIVAIVNDEVITREDLEDFLRELPVREDLQGESRRQKALDRLIEDKLILQKAKKIGIEVSPEEIEEIIRKIKNRFPSQEAFEEALLDAGLSYKTFVERHKDQWVIRKTVTREIRAKSRVSPREVEEYYKTHMDEFQLPEAWKLSHILIRKHSLGKEDPEAKKQAEQLLERLQNGEDFSELAKQYSEGSRKDEGGDLGFVERGQLMKEIEEALEDLPSGEISDIVETPTGYSIFHMDEKREGTVQEFKEIKGEIRERLLEEKIKKRYQEWIEELKKDAYIKR